MTENDQKKYGSAADLLVAGVSSILSLFPPTAAFGAMGSFGLLTWQNEQQQKFIHEVRQRLERLDKTKFDQFAVESDEFKALAVQAVEVASKSASELKRQALAQSLVNSVTLPTSQFSSKQTLLRILSQMSDEEILALTVLYECETSGRDEFALAGDGKPIITLEALFKKVKPKMGQEWSKEDNSVAYEGLAQLELAIPPPDILWKEEEMVRITALGNRLIQWCQDPNIEKLSKAEG